MILHNCASGLDNHLDSIRKGYHKVLQICLTHFKAHNVGSCKSTKFWGCWFEHFTHCSGFKQILNMVEVILQASQCVIECVNVHQSISIWVPFCALSRCHLEKCGCHDYTHHEVVDWRETPINNVKIILVDNSISQWGNPICCMGNIPKTSQTHLWLQLDLLHINDEMLHLVFCALNAVLCNLNIKT